MIIKVDGWVRNVIEESRNGNKKIWVFLKNDVDGICSSAILSSLFQFLSHCLIPIDSNSELLRILKKIISSSDKKIIILLNCGGAIPLEERLGGKIDFSRSTTLILDSHRPLHHTNLISKKFRIISDDISSDKIRRLRSFLEDIEDEEADGLLNNYDDEEDDGSDLKDFIVEEDEIDETTGERKPKSTEITPLQRYYDPLTNPYGPPSAFLISRGYFFKDHNHTIHRSLIWLCCVSCVDCLLTRKNTIEEYQRIYQELKHDLRDLPEFQRNDCFLKEDEGLYYDDQEAKLVLHRHWNLYESMMHSSPTVKYFKSWTDAGEIYYKQRMAELGFSTLDLQVDSLMNPRSSKIFKFIRGEFGDEDDEDEDDDDNEEVKKKKDDFFGELKSSKNKRKSNNEFDIDDDDDDGLNIEEFIDGGIDDSDDDEDSDEEYVPGKTRRKKMMKEKKKMAAAANMPDMNKKLFGFNKLGNTSNVFNEITGLLYGSFYRRFSVGFDVSCHDMSLAIQSMSTFKNRTNFSKNFMNVAKMILVPTSAGLEQKEFIKIALGLARSDQVSVLSHSKIVMNQKEVVKKKGFHYAHIQTVGEISTTVFTNLALFLLEINSSEEVDTLVASTHISNETAYVTFVNREPRHIIFNHAFQKAYSTLEIENREDWHNDDFSFVQVKPDQVRQFVELVTYHANIIRSSSLSRRGVKVEKGMPLGEALKKRRKRRINNNDDDDDEEDFDGDYRPSSSKLKSIKKSSSQQQQNIVPLQVETRRSGRRKVGEKSEREEEEFDLDEESHRKKRKI